MLKKLKRSRGGGSIFPIILMIIVTSVSILTIFMINLDTNLRSLQKDRYIKAVDMAVNTAMANIELSDSVDDLNSNLNAQQNEMGILYEASSLDLLAAGYSVQKRIMVNKEALMDTFYSTLLKNFQIKGLDKVASFQRYIPLKAILQYDTISVSTGMHYDTSLGYNGFPKNKYVDDWQDIRLSFKVGTTDVFMTLGDECYTLIDPTAPMVASVPAIPGEILRFSDANKTKIDVTDPANNSVGGVQITPERKNEEMAMKVQSVLRAYANSPKLIKNELGVSSYYQNANKNVNYQMSIAEVDNVLHDKNTADKINGAINAAKDVTFYCLVEGLPMKSLLKGQINNSFSTFSYGGAALKRADE